MIVKIFDFNSAFDRDYFLLGRFIVFKYFDYFWKYVFKNFRKFFYYFNHSTIFVFTLYFVQLYY